MAPKLKDLISAFGQSSNCAMLFTLTFFLFFSLILGSKNDVNCTAKNCYWLDSKFKGPVKVQAEDGGDSWKIFCYTGLEQSLVYLWSDPVLRVTRDGTDVKGSKNTLIAHYGTVVADVEQRRSQAGYSFLQQLISSLHSFQQTADFSLAAFNHSCIGIQTDISYKAQVAVKVVNLWFVAYLASGILLFFSARSWSHNTSLHYGTGVSVGVIASLVVLLFILSRFLPQKLKSIGYVLLFIGSSTSLYLLTSITRFLSDPVADAMLEYWQYILGYCIVMGAISFVLVYRYGPVTDSRTLNLIQWFLQGLGLFLVFSSTQIREVSFALIIIVLTVYNFPTSLFYIPATQRIWHKFFTPKVKLLTEDEYTRQGAEETQKALEELRNYCRSPDCHAWKVVSCLKEPKRFADFVEGDSWHVTDEELLEYDSGPDPAASHLLSDSDEESEMEFALNGP